MKSAFNIPKAPQVTLQRREAAPKAGGNTSAPKTQDLVYLSNFNMGFFKAEFCLKYVH